MPLDGWDHVELWVGNAKQSAYYYEHAFGFRCTAYAGPEEGVRCAGGTRSAISRVCTATA
jgi:4-hydroxyphenylpyruvate dioxygenase